MSEPSLSMTADDDDLPRTIRREREAREREARERQSAIPSPAFEREAFVGSIATPSGAPAATVADFDVPFVRLSLFFLKAVFAAIPALLVLTALLWLFGQGLQSFFPQLLKMKILIYMPPQ
jgi:hypothetical protein